ncbi:hypothetical protein [Corynebacterium lactis]|uniref:Uncharacterized protein n=1 Tax=Corynebacterium lactis RW2-5 TaxID=1408189 RepID=A0A0K2H3Y0_9CORY|nr:hypothetical protein [Corynebacterium lactis]ALA68421.1 hypothetical protein CLAC_03170 [Corynebacterium lactis RW2-5]
MSISMHLDEYMESRGITPDDTVVVDDPCSVFDGRVERSEKLDNPASQLPLPVSGDSADEESERRLAAAEDSLKKLMD